MELLPALKTKVKQVFPFSQEDSGCIPTIKDELFY